jgi:hypothetical protein
VVLKHGRSAIGNFIWTSDLRQRSSVANPVADHTFLRHNAAVTILQQ